MKLTKFKTLYPEKGKTSISQFIGKAGVYIIKHNNKIVYVGSSKSDCYKALTRHFQDWTSSKQKRVEYPQTKEYKVRLIICTPTQAKRLENLLIKKYQPKDNSNQMDIEYNVTAKEIRENQKVLESLKKSMDRGPVPF